MGSKKYKESEFRMIFQRGMKIEKPTCVSVCYINGEKAKRDILKSMIIKIIRSKRKLSSAVQYVNVMFVDELLLVKSMVKR